ncbi:hypothetical protein [Robiginitalea marina]|uniref:Uncharacterized protein n=1 Tax=Robiginitalea marina TaxID=2954105 RepID=A0ABT1AV49_9FLAO|nr:hypothetical protein [Robiginitalea marina]MCO5723934.1 hypothetical protein [Robiginitalea marina]
MKKDPNFSEAQTITHQDVQLVRGTFTPSEAADVILSLLDEKINFHKLQRLRWCEGYFKADTSYADQRIAELEAEKVLARNFIRQAREQGKCLNIKGTLEITMENE